MLSNNKCAHCGAGGPDTPAIKFVKFLLPPIEWTQDSSTSGSNWITGLFGHVLIWWYRFRASGKSQPLRCSHEFLGCREHYRGYHLIWTGWKVEQNSTKVAAQWLAWPLIRGTGPYIYQCGNHVGPYILGEKFNTNHGKEPLELFIDAVPSLATMETGQMLQCAAYGEYRRIEGLARLKQYLWTTVWSPASSGVKGESNDSN